MNALRIGIVSDLFELDDLVGEDHESWGIISTGDFNHNKKVTQYANKLQTGDIVKVILNRKEGTLSFVINDKDCGVAYWGKELKTKVLFPVITLRESKVKFIN